MYSYISFAGLSVVRPLNYYLEAMRFFNVFFHFCDSFLFLISDSYHICMMAYCNIVGFCDIVLWGFSATKLYLKFIFLCEQY